MHLKELRLSWMLNANFNDLCCGLTSNWSIQLLNFDALGGIDGEGAQILENGIIHHAPLKELEMIHPRSMSHKDFLEILAALHANPNCRIETFVLCSYDINAGAAISLSNVLLCHTPIPSGLWNFVVIEINVTRAFCQFLQKPNSVLEKLNLSCNAIREDIAAALTNALINNSRLRELDLSTNRSITPAWWIAFLTVRHNPISALEKLNLSCNEIINEIVEAVTTSLATNTRLRELDLSCNFNVTTAGWVTFSKRSTQSQHSVGETAHACQS